MEKKTIKKKKYNMPRGREMGKERNGMASQLLAGGNMQCLLAAYVNILVNVVDAVVLAFSCTSWAKRGGGKKK